MPIRPYLNGYKFDPETIRVVGVAYEMARTAFHLRDKDNVADEVLAKKIIEIAQAGETCPDRLCEKVLMYFRGETRRWGSTGGTSGRDTPPYRAVM